MQDVKRVVCTAIVDADNFSRLVCLSIDRSEAGFDVRAYVVAGNDNGHALIQICELHTLRL
jgi:hypothetical protein